MTSHERFSTPYHSRKDRRDDVEERKTPEGDAKHLRILMVPWSSIATSPPFRMAINWSPAACLCRNYKTERIRRSSSHVVTPQDLTVGTRTARDSRQRWNDRGKVECSVAWSRDLYLCVARVVPPDETAFDAFLLAGSRDTNNQQLRARRRSRQRAAFCTCVSASDTAPGLLRLLRRRPLGERTETAGWILIDAGWLPSLCARDKRQLSRVPGSPGKFSSEETARYRWMNIRRSRREFCTTSQRLEFTRNLIRYTVYRAIAIWRKCRVSTKKLKNVPSRTCTRLYRSPRLLPCCCRADESLGMIFFRQNLRSDCCDTVSEYRQHRPDTLPSEDHDTYLESQRTLIKRMFIS